MNKQQTQNKTTTNIKHTRTQQKHQHKAKTQKTTTHNKEKLYKKKKQ